MNFFLSIEFPVGEIPRGVWTTGPQSTNHSISSRYVINKIRSNILTQI